MLTELPLSFLHQVLQYLPLHERFRLLLVCRGLRTAVELSLSQVNGITTIRGAEHDGIAYYRLAADPFILNHILKYCNSLRTLIIGDLIKYNVKETRRIVSQIAANIPSTIRHLVWNVGAKFPITINPDWHLTHLSCPEHVIPGSGIANLFNNGLRSLIINGTDFQDWDQLPAGFQHLVTRNTPIDFERVCRSEGMKDLVTLHALSCPKLCLPAGMKLPNLKDLSIYNSKSYERDESASEALSSFIMNSKIKKLGIKCIDAEIININSNDEANGPIFYKTIHRVESLDIDCSSVHTYARLSDIHFWHLVSSTPKLKEISLSLPNISGPQLRCMIAWKRLEKVVTKSQNGNCDLDTKSYITFVVEVLCHPVTTISMSGVSLLFRKADQRNLLRLIDRLNSHHRFKIQVSDRDIGDFTLRCHTDVDRIFTSINISPADLFDQIVACN